MIPKLFECSRNSLPGKSLQSGWGDFLRDFRILIFFFWEIFLFPSEENPWIFGISASHPCGFWDFRSCGNLSWNSLLGSEFNNFCAFFFFLGSLSPKFSFPRGQPLGNSIKPQFSWISLEHKFLLFSWLPWEENNPGSFQGLGAEESKNFPQFLHNSTPKFGEKGAILRKTPPKKSRITAPAASHSRFTPGTGTRLFFPGS